MEGYHQVKKMYNINVNPFALDENMRYHMHNSLATFNSGLSNGKKALHTNLGGGLLGEKLGEGKYFVLTGS